MPKKKTTPLIAVTMGDPAGIGPEILIKALTGGRLPKTAHFVVIGDRGIVERAASHLGLKVSLPSFHSAAGTSGGKGNVSLWEASRLPVSQVRPGRPDGRWGPAVLEYIRLGAQWALAGEVQALVTAPISKEIIRQTHPTFTGHTEFLAHLAHTRRFGMMLAGKRLRVSLVTIHQPLRKAIRQIKTKKILETIELTQETLTRRFGIKEPRLAVAGLNPHAGEGGAFGSEESDLIQPAIQSAQDRGFRVSGPHPPDTVFYRAARGEYDAVVALYHDQGLIPLKLLHFEDGVNLTMGLPFIRTSVDHGTAFDIAGQGTANPDSLLAALHLAADFRRREHSWP
jgi:4-hydroxythreonine-4-phosphate dehydrogenase